MDLELFLKTLNDKKKFDRSIETNDFRLLKKNENIHLEKFISKFEATNSYNNQFNSKTPFNIPKKTIDQKAVEKVYQQRSSLTKFDYLFHDVLFHSISLRYTSSSYFMTDEDESFSFDGTFFALTWIYPFEIKIIFDSLYHLDCIFREIHLNILRQFDNKTCHDYKDMIFALKASELLSAKFHLFFVYFHHYFHIEYMYRHFRRWERFPLRMDIFYDLLMQNLIHYVFDDDYQLFDTFYQDDEHLIPIQFKYQNHVYTLKIKNTWNQEIYSELMKKFKLFLGVYCLPFYHQKVFETELNKTISRFHCYDLTFRDNMHHPLHHVSMIYGKTSSWLIDHCHLFPVNEEFLYQTHNLNIINHHHKNIIF